MAACTCDTRRPQCFCTDARWCERPEAVAFAQGAQSKGDASRSPHCQLSGLEVMRPKGKANGERDSVEQLCRRPFPLRDGDLRRALPCAFAA